MFKVTFYCLFWICFVGSGGQALTCLETDENGEIIETTSEEFTYCALSPELIDGKTYVGGRAFGVGPSIDSTGGYDNIFNLTSDMYTILSVCIYERYDIGKIASRLSFKEPEFMFRCFCNFDRCNREKNFFRYIANLRAESENAA